MGAPTDSMPEPPNTSRFAAAHSASLCRLMKSSNAAVEHLDASCPPATAAEAGPLHDEAAVSRRLLLPGCQAGESSTSMSSAAWLWL